MTDQCKSCTLRGDITACKNVECFHHENWYAFEQQKKIEELEKEVYRLKDLLIKGETE